MSDKHLSTQFDAELSGISTRVLEMGGIVESQVARSVYALTNFSGDIASDVLRLDKAAHLEHARRDAAEFGVELRGKVLVRHVVPLFDRPFSRNAR